MRVYYPKSLVQIDAVLHDYGDSSQKPEFHFVLTPVSVLVNKNSYSEADTFSLTARFEDFPFDPRLIRSVRVTIFILDLKEIRDFTSQDLQKSKGKIVFTGFADTHTIQLNESERVVKMDGRDYTALLIDSTFDNANLIDSEGKRTRKINRNRPVKEIIRDLLNNVPSAKNIEIDDRTEGKGERNLQKIAPNFKLTSGEEVSDGKFFYTEKNDSYWDVIVSICETVALIVYIELDKLVLSTPRVLYQGGIQGKQSIPFVYGFNLMNLEFHRNLGKKKRFNIVLRSFDLRKNLRAQVSIPRDATQEWADSMNVNKGVVMVKELNAEGVAESRVAPAYSFLFGDYSRDELIEYGQKIFEEYTRQQVEGSCDTHEMVVNDSRGVEFDLLQLKIGTPIQIEIAQEDVKNILRTGPEGDKVSDGDRVAYLVKRGYPKKVAEDLIHAVSKGTGKLRPTFYTREVVLDMSDQGFSCRIGFVNYIQLGEKIAGKLVSG